jgi:hypothetical protein
MVSQSFDIFVSRYALIKVLLFVRNKIQHNVLRQGDCNIYCIWIFIFTSWYSFISNKSLDWENNDVLILADTLTHCTMGCCLNRSHSSMQVRLIQGHQRFGNTTMTVHSGVHGLNVPRTEWTADWMHHHGRLNAPPRRTECTAGQTEG